MNAVARLRREDGQGLVELIVALTILAVGIGAVLTVLTSSALSLQRSDQKGTALTLAETQLELYRNLGYNEIRLDDASWTAAPLTNAADPYFTASASDSNIPSGAEANEITDTASGEAACATPLPPECEPVRTITGPDHRLYRIDTYITTSTPTDDGKSTGNQVGDSLKQVTVVVRNAELASLPILARNTSTFSDVNAAAFGGKQYPNLTINVPKAWVTGTSGTVIPASSISVTVSNGLYPLSSGSSNGTLTLYAIASATSPSPPCGTGDTWTQIGTMTVDNGNVTYQSSGAATVAPGTYWWWVHFSGDSSNEQQSSRCSPAMTTTQVQAAKWTPSISVSAPSTATTGVQVAGSKFSATLTNASPGATGTIHIKYVAAGSGPSPCPSGTELGTASATGNGSYSQANAFPAATDGIYWWWATYDGDSNNDVATSVCGSSMPSTIVGAGPSLVSMTMQDTNNNGKVDHVVATFNKSLNSCAAPCTAGWTLSNVPSGGSLSSVTTSGSTATLTLAEGTGAPDTTVGTFTVALDSSSGIVDTLSRHGSFAATAPADGAGPVPIAMSSTNKVGGTARKAEAGDTVTVTFSEPIATIGGATSTVTMSTSSGSGKPVTLSLTNLSSAAFQIGKKTNYMSGSGSAVFGSAASSVAISGNQVTVTLGTWNGVGTLQTGNYVAGATTAFSPASSIKDAAGNAAAGSLATTITFF